MNQIQQDRRRSRRTIATVVGIGAAAVMSGATVAVASPSGDAPDTVDVGIGLTDQLTTIEGRLVSTTTIVERPDGSWESRTVHADGTVESAASSDAAGQGAGR